jgi:hypothetical protein
MCSSELFAGRAIEEFPGGVGVSGMTSRLIDQVEQDPPKVGVLGHATRLGEGRRGPNGSIGGGRPVTVGRHGGGHR